MTLHRATQGFDHSAGVYEAGRPDYPAPAIDTIIDTLRITPSSTTLDLAAGTGKLTRLLIPTRAHIIAIEPVPGMRHTLAQMLPNLDIRAGTAEDLPLPDSSIDAVTVGQAFHWFANQQAVAEIHRVLRPGGGLALIWNQRDMHQPLQRQITDIIEAYRDDVPTHRSGEWRAAIEDSNLFSPIQAWHFPHTQEVDAEGLVARFLSISFIAALPEDRRTHIRHQILDLVKDIPQPYFLHYTTDLYCFRKVG